MSRGPDSGGAGGRSGAPAVAAAAKESQGGITRRVALRLLEAFFRRWFLYLLPLVLLAALGVSSVAGTTKKWQSVGTLSAARDTVLTEISGTGNDFGFETPATVTAREINELLRTEEFSRLVAAAAGLSGAVETGAVFLDTIRSSTSAFADGDNLVKVASRTESPELSFRLVKGTIESYTQWVIDGKVNQSSSAEAFYDSQLPLLQDTVTTARENLTTYLNDNVAPVQGDRPVDQQVEINRLTAEIDRAEARLTDALDKREAARLTTAQTRSDIGQQLRLVDEPRPATAPQPRFKTAVTTFALFVILGAIVSIAAIAAAASLDRTVRIPDDITSKLGLEVLAVVPDVRV